MSKAEKGVTDFTLQHDSVYREHMGPWFATDVGRKYENYGFGEAFLTLGCTWLKFELVAVLN
jgi:hypothetical protein